MDSEQSKQNLLSFLDWYLRLNPTDKVSVWSKDGQWNGLFNMDNEQIVDKYLDKIKKEESKKRKVCPEKIDGSCPLHNLHCQFPDCEK